jgi:hypothetical protein
MRERNGTFPTARRNRDRQETVTVENLNAVNPSSILQYRTIIALIASITISMVSHKKFTLQFMWKLKSVQYDYLLIWKSSNFFYCLSNTTHCIEYSLFKFIGLHYVCNLALEHMNLSFSSVVSTCAFTCCPCAINSTIPKSHITAHSKSLDRCIKKQDKNEIYDEEQVLTWVDICCNRSDNNTTITLSRMKYGSPVVSTIVVIVNESCSGQRKSTGL